MEQNKSHIGVMTQEVLEILKPKKGEIVLDATLGGGDHSLKLLESGQGFTHIGIDVDMNSVEAFAERIGVSSFSASYKGNKLVLVNSNFTDIDRVLGTLKIHQLDKVIADLGWSTDQLKSLEGLSFESQDAYLDMRFDKNLAVKASDLLNGLGRKELERMFKDYSDLTAKEAKDLTSAIIAERTIKKFSQVKDLNKVIATVKPGGAGIDNHFAAKVYQALRIAVNSEFSNLKSFIGTVFALLKPGGILTIITFHSGEQNIVEQAFKNLYKQGKASLITNFKNKSYMQPTVDELMLNIKSRSAKLFAIKKL